MRILHIALIMIFGLGIIISNHAFADDTKGVWISDIRTQPLTIKVGDKLTINATLVNNSPNPIYLQYGICEGRFSVAFDSHVTVDQKKLSCPLMLIQQKLDSGQKTTVINPSTNFYTFRAASAGAANATVTFSYVVFDNITQSNISKTVSKSFLFTVLENKTGITLPTHGTPPFTFTITSPLKQLKSGIAADDVKCGQDLQLVIKAEDGSPACVKPQTAQKLVERGWGKILSQETKLVSENPADASNNFAFSLFSNLVHQNQSNVFFSPYSISSAFSIVYEGANGKTRDEIQSVFHFITDDQTRRNSAYTMLSELNRPGQNYTLSSANALWVQNNFPFLKGYTDVVEKYYLAKATNLDFENKTEDSRQTINKWVQNKTNDKIKDLLPPRSIDYLTRAVITNAVYFKGYWATPFDQRITQDEDFKKTEKETVKVPMMNAFAYFNYTSNNDLQVLQMPYKGNKLSMLVLLPKNNDLQSLEQKLSPTNLDEWKSKLTTKQVQVYMPKFTFNTKYALVDNLKGMGILSAFDPNLADLSGMDGQKNLYISGVFHQAFVAVDEKGTEAAAATGIIAEETSAPLPQEIFRADHPFIFLIQDDRTGLILFMGKVVDPSV